MVRQKTIKNFFKLKINPGAKVLKKNPISNLKELKMLMDCLTGTHLTVKPSLTLKPRSNKESALRIQELNGWEDFHRK